MNQDNFPPNKQPINKVISKVISFFQTFGSINYLKKEKEKFPYLICSTASDWVIQTQLMRRFAVDWSRNVYVYKRIYFYSVMGNQSVDCCDFNRRNPTIIRGYYRLRALLKLWCSFHYLFNMLIIIPRSMASQDYTKRQSVSRRLCFVSTYAMLKVVHPFSPDLFS